MRLSALTRAATTAGAASAEFVNEKLLTINCLGQTSSSDQLRKMRSMVKSHQSAVQFNADSRSNHPTFVDNSIDICPQWGFLSLPPVMGKHRVLLREAIATSPEVRQQCASVLSLKPLPADDEYSVRAVVIGAKSITYLERLLRTFEHDATLSRASDDPVSPTMLVMDHDVGRIVEAAFRLRPRFGHRVTFCRCDASFVFRYLVRDESVDVVVLALPVPHLSRQASHRRLLTRDLFNLIHPTVKVRRSASDARGIVAFTDCLPYAEFCAAQLEESKLVVPWARKKPETFGMFVPVPEDALPLRDADRVVTVAAAKSGSTTPNARDVNASFDFGRRYYDALAPGPSGGDEGEGKPKTDKVEKGDT